MLTFRQWLERKYVLTSVETRMDACQVVPEIYFQEPNVYVVRFPTKVTTNQRAKKQRFIKNSTDNIIIGC